MTQKLRQTPDGYRSVRRKDDRATSFVSRVSGFSNLSLASDLVAIHSPWNLRRFAPRNDGWAHDEVSAEPDEFRDVPGVARRPIAMAAGGDRYRPEPWPRVHDASHLRDRHQSCRRSR